MHTIFSSDSRVTPESLVRRCVQVGLNCIAVTDHNTIEGALAVRQISPFVVIVGEEVRSSGGEITGLFLKENIPSGLSPIETVRIIKDQGGIVSIPHPFDRFRSGVISKVALEEVLSYVDIIEVFNSRNISRADDVKAEKFALEHGLLTSGVSDAHTTFELGRTYVKMREFDGGPDDFKRALSQGVIIRHRSSAVVHLATTFNRFKSRLSGLIAF